MFLDAYHSVRDGVVRITAEQASRFAKEIAADFNPIHDADARRFCVPGDLLCALVLGHYGLSARMSLRFRGMVGRELPLRFPAAEGEAFSIEGEDERPYLDVERAGEVIRDAAVVEAFIRRYSAFSGRNFPEFLTPLMRDRGVMFNPDRPLVLYDGMTFELEAGPGTAVDMELVDASLEVQGKRGEEWLRFRITDSGRVIGAGTKRVVISGLQPFDEARMQGFVDDYTARRNRFSP